MHTVTTSFPHSHSHSHSHSYQQHQTQHTFVDSNHLNHGSLQHTHQHTHQPPQHTPQHAPHFVVNHNHSSHSHQTVRNIDLSNPTNTCGKWSISVPPVGSISQTKCSDGSSSITSCIGVPSVLQDCSTISTASDGGKTFTDTTVVGPYSWSQTFKINY